MISLLLRFWPYILGGLAILALVLVVLHWRSEAAKVPALEEQVSSLSAQIIAEREQVKKNQELTANIEGSYAKKISNLNASLRKLRDRPATCVSVQPSGQANGGNGAAPGGVAARPNGILDSKLIDFAGEAETYRLRLIGCQGFVNKLYEVNQ